MGNLFTRTYNKIQYEISKKVSDPEADNYAKQQQAQAVQDKAAAERKAALDKQKGQKKQEDAEKKKEADELAKRSRFSPISEQIHTITKTVNLYATLFIILGLGLYGGKISANQAIGYNIPFRILSFFYGFLLFFIVIPVAFVKKYLYGIKILNYTFIPLKVHVTTGWAERVLIGPYCYQEDADCFSEKAKVAELYKNGYDNSLKAAAAVVAGVAAASAAIAAASSVKTTPPSSPKPAGAPPGPPPAKPAGPPPPPAKPVSPKPAGPPPAKPVGPPPAKPASPPATPPAKPATPPPTPPAKPASPKPSGIV